MDLNFTKADQAFRQEVIEFLSVELPADISRRVHAVSYTHLTLPTN